MSYSIIGGVLAAFFHGIIVSQFPRDPKLEYAISAVIRAFAIARPVSEDSGFVEGFKIDFNNKPFFLVTLIYMFS
jgi:hypothetical protein